MPLNIITKGKGGGRSEATAALKKALYDRELRDGARFRSKAGTKEQIKKALEQ